MNLAGVSRRSNEELAALLLPIMRAKGVRLPVEEFHARVDLIFHACESTCYDSLHSDLRLSLPRQFDLLIGDLFRHQGPPKTCLHVLDAGCGTGLSAEILLGTRLSPYIEHLDLLDTCREMLDQCAQRRCFMGRKVRLIHAPIEQLLDTSRYDVILACSVLHHISDLETFVAKIARLQSDGGLFLHLQDPNGDCLDDKQLRARMKILARAPELRLRRVCKRISPKSAFRLFRRTVQQKRPTTYIQDVNQRLLEAGIIERALSETEIWRITDLRVHDGKGVSIQRLHSLLPAYRLVSQRSYSFFGELYSNLPYRFRSCERDLTSMQAPNGMHLSALWKRLPESV